MENIQIFTSEGNVVIGKRVGRLGNIVIVEALARTVPERLARRYKCNKGAWLVYSPPELLCIYKPAAYPLNKLGLATWPGATEAKTIVSLLGAFCNARGVD